MKLEQIKNIATLLNLHQDQRILGYDIKPLTAPGENYGSVILSADICIESDHGKDEINVVVKMVPPGEFLQELFNIQVTFRNEVAFYKNVIPLLQDFQREHAVEKVMDFFPKYYGSRFNLNNNDKVDLDAALVLENLKMDNYVTVERTKGLDLDVTKLILSDLAYFHAVPLALKLQKPQVFETEIKPYLSTWLPLEESHNKMRAQLSLIIDQIDELTDLKDRILRGFDMEMVPHSPLEPFATIAHNDCWTNNNMLKFDGTRPIKNKLVDYQCCDYGSPARDLVFFLFSSVQNEVIEKHYDGLLEFYHENFTAALKELHCDSALFSFEALEKEMEFEARYTEFAHVLFMLFVICAKKENVKELADVTPDSLVTTDVSDLFKKNLVFVVNEFAKRNWI